MMDLAGMMEGYEVRVGHAGHDMDLEGAYGGGL